MEGIPLGKVYEVNRAKEVVDVALALYMLGINYTIDEVKRHIKIQYDRDRMLVYFYFISEEIKEKFLEIRECKMNNKPIQVSDYYKCSHLVGMLKRCIKIEKDKAIY